MKISARTPGIGLTVAVAASSLFVIGTATTASAVPVPSCTDVTGFDTTNEGWRDQSFMQGGTAGLFTSFGPVEWLPDDGSPDNGSIEAPDQDNGWQEVASPALSGADHSAMAGQTLTFAYKYATDGQNVSNAVYVALRGNGGDAVYFPFQDQTAASGTWATVTVPMTAAGWLDGFTYDTGATGSAPSDADFAAILGSLDEIAISVEGSDVDNDLTRVDTLALTCPEPEEPQPEEPGDETPAPAPEPDEAEVPMSPSVPAGGSAESLATADSGALTLLAGGLALLLGVGGAATWRERGSFLGRHRA